MASDPLFARMKHKGGRALLLTGKAVAHRTRRFLDHSEVKRRYVFVGGVQRSGTNMMMDVLERSYETDVYHEWDTRAFHGYLMRDRPVIHHLAEQSPAPVFIIKALCELQELSSLMDEFAPSQLLWVLRNYEDVVNSMLVSFKNQAQQMRRLVMHGEASPAWIGKGISDETFAVLKRLVHDDINDASAAALLWYSRNRLFFDRRFDRDHRAMLVRYESLVTDPANQFKRIFEFLNLRFTPRIVRTVFASSIRRHRPPSIEAPVREICEGLYACFAEAETAHEAAGARSL